MSLCKSLLVYVNVTFENIDVRNLLGLLASLEVEINNLSGYNVAFSISFLLSTVTTLLDLSMK